MTRSELIDRLKRFEWSDVEFKEALNAAPKVVYETVSAFANTAGEWLVFGVHDRGGALAIVGIMQVDKVQNDFLSVLRSGQKINRAIGVAEDVIETDGKTLRVFHIPESPRSDKPVHLDGDIRRSFIRRGAGDERCSTEEIERFLRDASADRYDGEPLVGPDAEEFFDSESARWYRRVFDDTTLDAWSTDRRWTDRIVVEENLVQAWLMLSERYVQHAEHPFGMDAARLRRDDVPPDYISFREAAINLLIHQDYGDHGRKASIKFFRDRTVFWNPGDAFARTDELLDPTEKEVRNPAIVAAFRRIGLGEQAGTGLRAIFRGWQRLGHVPPVIKSDKAGKTFELLLLRERLLSEEQQLLQAQLGVKLNETEARLFAFACRQRGASLTDAKAVTGQARPEARNVLHTLAVQGLLHSLGDAGRYGLAEHLKGSVDPPQLGQPTIDQDTERDKGSVSDQLGDPATKSVTPLLTNLTDDQRKIISLCEVPRKQAYLMQETGLSHRTFFRRKRLDPLIQAKLIRMTHPDEPNHPDQAYVVTDAALALLNAWRTDAGRERDS